VKSGYVNRVQEKSDGKDDVHFLRRFSEFRKKAEIGFSD
jgi:hypothetical protein